MCISPLSLCDLNSWPLTVVFLLLQFMYLFFFPFMPKSVIYICSFSCKDTHMENCPEPLLLLMERANIKVMLWQLLCVIHWALHGIYSPPQPWVGRWFYHQFTDEKTEVQQGSVTCMRTGSSSHGNTGPSDSCSALSCLLLSLCPQPSSSSWRQEAGRKPGKEKRLRTTRLPWVL